MKLYTLKTKQQFNHPIQQVFKFFSSPENLAFITPEEMDFKIMTPIPISMNQGRIIDYTVKICGLPIRWRSLITTYEAPLEFIDEQLNGPYAFWHHKHHFQEFDKGTLMTDTVTYAMPFGWLGRFMHWIAVRGQLDKIFNYRKESLKKIFSERITEGVNT